MEEQSIRLTQYSHGGGCGCKIAPSVLEEILQNNMAMPDDDKLLVGNSSKDDACAYDIGNGKAIISTTDFFTPIVDDAYDFGRIASANAISDVYAMGGTPVVAIAILGWPIDKLPASLAKKVIEGSRAICAQAGIMLAGGHSIDGAEPFFGLAVTGSASIPKLKKNSTAQAGDVLFLTKSLGVGILATAQKRNIITPQQKDTMVQSMTTINSVGEALGNVDGVHAMTDVTGFGLIGHLTEMVTGSNVSAIINYNALQVMQGVTDYIKDGVMPGATARNWASCADGVLLADGMNEAEAKGLLPDPQTNGGLLIAVAPNAVDEVKDILTQNGRGDYITPIGTITNKGEYTITVQP